MLDKQVKKTEKRTFPPVQKLEFIVNGMQSNKKEIYSEVQLAVTKRNQIPRKKNILGYGLSVHVLLIAFNKMLYLERLL